MTDTVTGGITPATRRPEIGEALTGPTIFVPLDGSPRSLAALPVAKALAELEGGTLHVVHVSARVVPPSELVRELGLGPEDLFGTVVDEIAGSPAEAISRLAELAEDARVVLSAQGDAQHGGRALGHVAEQVISTVKCPVILVRPERGLGRWWPRRVLLAHDGSPQTASGFGPAVEVAQRAESALYVLHVATLTGEASPGTLPVPPYVDQPHHEWPEWTREFLDRMEVFCNLPPELKPRLFLSRGDPGEEILRFSENRRIDLIALAWHGSFDEHRGRTAREVILTAPCPVIFLRAAEFRPEEAFH